MGGTYSRVQRGNVGESSGGGGAASSVDKYTLSTSGRASMNTSNDWATHQVSFGPYEAQWTSVRGNATLPTHSYTELGFNIPPAATLKKVSLICRANSTEITGMSMYIAIVDQDLGTSTEVDSNGEVTSTGVYGPTEFITANANDLRAYSSALNYTTTNISNLKIYFKPTGTLTASRFFYFSIAIDYEV